MKVATTIALEEYGNTDKLVSLLTSIVDNLNNKLRGSGTSLAFEPYEVDYPAAPTFHRLVVTTNSESAQKLDYPWIAHLQAAIVELSTLLPISTCNCGHAPCLIMTYHEDGLPWCVACVCGRFVRGATINETRMKFVVGPWLNWLVAGAPTSAAADILT